MEYFDVYNPDGTKTGEVIERSLAHSKGVLHAAVHIYIYRKKEGRLQILLQKRADNKDSFPSCYDTSCAGHVSAGETMEEAAVKELSEELGLRISPHKLNLLFTQVVEKINTFYGKKFIDREINNVYSLCLDLPVEAFTFQKEEISQLKWMDATSLLYELLNQNKEYCIMPETYKRALKKIEG